MALAGQVSPQAQAVNEARDRLTTTIGEVVLYWKDRDDIVAAIEQFIDAKINAQNDAKY